MISCSCCIDDRYTRSRVSLIHFVFVNCERHHSVTKEQQGKGVCAVRGRREKMQQASASSPLPALSNGYQPLPSMYLGSWPYGRPQASPGHSAPGGTAISRYSCVHLQTCSLWMSFGAYVTGILFQTASFVSFMLISHGYCIMCERLSIRERRTTAVLGCLLYLSLIGLQGRSPYFTVFLLINYFASFYIIFRRTSQNLIVLQEQLSFVEEEEIHSLHGTLNTKRFQGTMQVAAVAFIMFCIFMYIGWNFRIPEASLHLPVIPLMTSAWEITMPPIYSVRTGSGCSAQPSVGAGSES
ncbi:hypothetical protein HU200_010564 [Digitaria exilis]|uniref:Uncharacterized protein n=1 Tax=Digitaria exilis TaxID=1010633 RepID=A0A835FJV8_9POAL|nr:hypothetical protein HU200_010564 [Digitaria exilis]